MKSILADVSNKEFKQTYLLYGEEAYLRHQYRDKLKVALLDGTDEMNYHHYDGKEVMIGAIIDQAETMPFFADRRVIIIENSGLFKQGGEALAEYIQNPAQTVFFIFVESEIDKRSKLFKTVRDQGRAVEFAIQETDVLTRWIHSLAQKEGKRIQAEAVAQLLERTGADMENIRREFEKLICYRIGETDLVKEDVEAVCTVRITNRIFEMVEAISEKNKEKTMKLYHDLMELREPPMRVLFLITRQFNILLQVKDLLNKGYGPDQIAKKVGVPPYFVQKYQRQSSRFTKEALKKALEECIAMDEGVKKGLQSDRLGLELLIISNLN